MVQEKFKLVFWKHWILTFKEATAQECFEHFFSIQRDENYIVDFIEKFIKDYWFEVDVEKIGIDVIYEQVSKTYFKDFFNETKWSSDSTPFYTLLDLISERVWDPYDFMERRTWRQVMALVKGIIWNKQAWTPEWDKENRKTMNRELWNVKDTKKIAKAVDDAVADFINNNK